MNIGLVFGVANARGATPAAVLCLFLFGNAQAQSLAPAGCPMFHCNPEATGTVYKPLIPAVLTSNSNGSLGLLRRQGCSGNGTLLACLYSNDKAKGNVRGTLKVLNATTLKAKWGSAGTQSTYDLDPATSTNGQAPVYFANGSIAAGDASLQVLYDSAGAVIATLPVGGSTNNFGLTPISATYGVVSQTDGVLTLVNMTTWTNAGTLTLVDPANGAPVNLVSPSSGTSGAMYAIAYDSQNGHGILYSVALNTATEQLTLGSAFTFTGASGASPVVVAPAASGLSNNLVLIAAPGLVGGGKSQSYLVALADSPASGLVQTWAAPVSGSLSYTPTVDPQSGTLYYQDKNGPNIHQISVLSGAPLQTFNLQAIGGFPGSFMLNGHIGSSQTTAAFTLLLAGTSSSTGAQYVMAFQPLVSPDALTWSSEIASKPASYTAAWNFAPSSQAGVSCPIAITVNTNASTIVRLCDH